MLKYNETGIPDNYSKELKMKNYDISRDNACYLLDIAIGAATDALKQLKSKDYPLAFVYKLPNDVFVAAGVVNYNKDKNWDYFWTFNKDDVPENAHILTVEDPKNCPYFRGFGTAKYGIGFRSFDAICVIIPDSLYIVSKWLDENAKEGETVSVQLEGTGIFSVTINDKGEKEKDIDVDGEYKVEVKDDIRHEE